MSLRTKSLYLSFFFLLTLVSCEKPSDIGLGLQGENNLLGTTFEKMNVAAGTVVQPDSIVAFKNNPILIGKATDGEFGTISAAHYTEVDLNGTGVSFDIAPNTEADSMVLVLAYTGYYYGDTTVAMQVNVLKLDENFKDAQTYFTTSTIPGNTVLGTTTFKPRYHRTKNNKGTPGSRLLRIKLDRNFASQVLTKSGQNDLSTQEEFRKFWPGIAIIPAPNSAAGSLVGFFTKPDTAGTPVLRVAGINLYYKDKNGAPKFHNFSLSGKYYFNTLKAEGPGKLPALAKGQELKSTDSNNEVYIQEYTGVKTLITFPEIETFKNGKGNIYINYAELVIPVKAGTINPSGKVAKAPESIILYESTKNKRVAKTTAGVSYTVQRGDASAFGISRPVRALYAADSNFYKADITSYAQALFDGKKANNGIIVSPIAEDAFTATASGLTFPGTITANRAIIDAGPGKIKLRIYYSQLN
ncbi:DUF4270 family protein [Adhaeribacter sp. BT258]|uniref:DUF4270 family protein n=1 Tax=Adhaeribacter terrigena TaxID=2793070 RepID=A0ABS1C2F3_9BACT|nr:DUF4270 family protein [Adhaeribacter terrigena]MBK0403499.1 DUF4270 family protein [Adhaeribacter terrigena]